MYICTNCAGHLRYDIKKEKLACDSCGSEFEIGKVAESKHFLKQEIQTENNLTDEPKSNKKSKDNDSHETYIFTCPQCAGEIRCDINEAATFCPFCGASNVLEGRLTSEKNPKYIIPFKIDKDECKNIYRKYVKSKIFAPSNILKEGAVDGFRGIYMPFWMFTVEQKGLVTLDGERTRHTLDYNYYDEYKLYGHIEAEYEGIMYDASSSFYDDYSQSISPFDIDDMKPFDSSYMAGFYADSSDVDEEIYESEALIIAGYITYYDFVVKKYDMTVKLPTDVPEAMKTVCSETDTAYLPVWFMAYNYKGRMLYSAINGQTGEIAADVPISIGKYILGAIILSVPIFLLLNLILSLNGPIIAAVSGIMAITAGILYSIMISKLKKIESKENDKGYVFAHKNEFDFDPEEASKEKEEIAELKKEIFSKKGIFILSVVAVLGLSTVAVPLLYIIFLLGKNFVMCVSGLLILIADVLVFIINLFNKSKSVKTHLTAVFLPFLAGLLVSIVLIIVPVHDMIYYIAAISTLTAMIFAVISLAKGYNDLISRPMPQFKRKGGEDNA